MKALAIMAIVYTVRLVWLLQFRNARERQPEQGTGWQLRARGPSH